MASVYDLKPAFSRLLRPLVAYLASHGVTANQVTVGAAVLSLVTGLTVGCLAPVRPGYFLLLPTVLLVRMGLNAIDGIDCRVPEGAFYAFPSVRGLLGRRAGKLTLDDDLAVAKFFLETARCAVVPGTAFGAPGFMRLSYAAGTETLRAGLSRIAEAVRTLA